MSQTKYRLFAFIWFLIFGWLGEYFQPGFLSIIFFIMMGLSLLTLFNSFFNFFK